MYEYAERDTLAIYDSSFFDGGVVVAAVALVVKSVAASLIRGLMRILGSYTFFPSWVSVVCGVAHIKCS